MIRLFHVHFASRTLFLAFTEVGLVIGAMFAAFVVRYQGDFALALAYEQVTHKLALAAGVLILCMYYYDLYDSLVLHRKPETLSRLVQALGTASIILAGIYYVYPDVQLGRGAFILWVSLSGALLAGWRLLFATFNRSKYLSDSAVLLGAGAAAIRISSEIKTRPELGIRLVGFFDSSSEVPSVNGLSRLGSIEELPTVVERERVRRIILTMNERRGRLPVEMLLKLKTAGLIIQDASEIFEAITGKVYLDSLRPSWLLFSDGFRVSHFISLYKRLASIVLSVVGIIVTAPIMLIISALIKLDSKGPVIFRQQRIGQGGKRFTMFKFRSMHAGADADGLPEPASPGDHRVTRVGYWLRRARLDELPQLLNILRGDMCFIGPRPFVPHTEAELASVIPFYSQRWVVKPGATGWAQINRGYCACLEDNADKLGYDLFYIKNLSVGLDCLIFFVTLKTLVLGRGGR